MDVFITLGFEAQNVGSCSPTFWESLPVPPLRVKQSSHCFTLEMGQTGGPETSVNNYKHRLRENQKSEDLIYTVAAA
jgi:hypothetical protein